MDGPGVTAVNGTGSSTLTRGSLPLTARFIAAISTLGEKAGGNNSAGQISSRRNSILDGVNLAIATKNKLMANAAGIVHDLLFYSIFLSLFVAVTMTRTFESIPNSWKNMLESRFAPLDRRLNSNGVIMGSFHEINSKDALWKYLEDTLAPAIVPDDDGAYSRSRLTGMIRAGQARSELLDCNLQAEGQWLARTTTCFSTTLSKSSFGGWNNDQGYSYDEDSQLSINRWLLGPDKQYGSGAYYTFLSQDLNTTRQLLQDWKNNHFIDLHTRALFIDFTLYNPGLDLFSVIRLLFEMPIYGGVVPSSFFRICSVKFYDKPSEYLSAVFEGLFLMTFAKMTRIMINEIRKSRWAYFKSTWNVIECLNTFIFIVIIMVTIVIRCCGSLLFNRINVDPYINWQYYAYSSNQLRNLTAVNAVLTWIRILKYMRISSRMSLLERAITTARTELLTWLAVFLTVYVSFVQAFFVGFHQNLASYKSFSTTSMTVFHGSFGHINFEELQEQNPVIGPVLCVVYICCMIFILLNMLLVILEDAWTKTLEEIKEEQIDGLAAALSAVLHSARSTAKKQKRMLSRMVRKKIPMKGNGGVSASSDDSSINATRLSYPERSQDDCFENIQHVNKLEDEDIDSEEEDEEEPIDDEEEPIDDEDEEQSESEAEAEAEDQLIQSMMAPKNYRRSI